MAGMDFGNSLPFCLLACLHSAAPKDPWRKMNTLRLISVPPPVGRFFPRPFNEISFHPGFWVSLTGSPLHSARSFATYGRCANIGGIRRTKGVERLGSAAMFDSLATLGIFRNKSFKSSSVKRGKGKDCCGRTAAIAAEKGLARQCGIVVGWPSGSTSFSHSSTIDTLCRVPKNPRAPLVAVKSKGRM